MNLPAPACSMCGTWVCVCGARRAQANRFTPQTCPHGCPDSGQGYMAETSHVRKVKREDHEEYAMQLEDEGRLPLYPVTPRTRL